MKNKARQKSFLNKILVGVKSTLTKSAESQSVKWKNRVILEKFCKKNWNFLNWFCNFGGLFRQIYIVDIFSEIWIGFITI